MMEQTKLFKLMSTDEQLVWLSGFTAWSNKELPHLYAYINAFDARCIEMFERGLTFISAFPYSRDFVEKSRTFRDVPRRLSRLSFYVDKIKRDIISYGAMLNVTEEPAEAPQPRRRGRPTKAESAAMERERAEAARREAVANLMGDPMKAVAEQRTSQKSESEQPVQRDLFSGQSPVATPTPLGAAVAMATNGGTRLHLDQLAWLMPADLQERIKQIAALRSKAADESNQAKELAERKVDASIIAPHTQAAIEATNTYKQIYADVDSYLADLYSLLYIGGEHIPAWEERCRVKGITVSQLMAVLKPYWEKAGKPVVSLESVTPPSPEEEKAKKERKARLHSIRWYFMRKDRKLTPERVETMRAMITELQGYGVATEEYEAVLAAAEKAISE